MKNGMLGFVLGLCVMLLLGAAHVRHVDGHCQSALSNIGEGGEAYLAITNTTTGRTVVHRFDGADFGRDNEAVFDAGRVNERPGMARAW